MKKTLEERERNFHPNNTERMYHIDGMKGILCFMVMLGHFWNIYRNCQEQSGFTSYSLDLIRGTFLNNPLLVASFWLYAFLVISGYLLSATRIRNVFELMKKAIKRFLRFFFPILGACLFIYLLQETVGFYAKDTSNYFINNWFQKFYPNELGWMAVFAESVRAVTSGDCRFNSPFWVIRDMLLSSWLIYIANYVDSGRDKKNNVLPLLFFLCAVYLDRPVMIACLAGYMLGYYKEQVTKLVKNKLLFFLVVAVSYACAALLMKWKVMPTVFDKIFLYILVWCAIVVYINQSAELAAFFSSKIFLLMGKISFGVYSFHWPVICSIGSLMLIYGLEHQWRAIVSFGMALLVSILSTVVLSVVYNKTVEAGVDRIIQMF